MVLVYQFLGTTFPLKYQIICKYVFRNTSLKFMKISNSIGPFKLLAVILSNIVFVMRSLNIRYKIFIQCNPTSSIKIVYE